MKTTIWEKENIEKLANASSAKDLLSDALELKRQKGEAITYAQLSRNAGFAARSFPRDVAVGLKSLTPHSAEKLGRALRFPASLRQYFVALVEHENDPSHRTERALLAGRKRLLTGRPREQAEELFFVEHFSQVYASLGKPELGATLTEIGQRSGLPQEEVTRVLTELMKRNLVEKKSGRYRASESHLSFNALRKDGAFNKLYLKRLSQAKTIARREFESDRNLFLESTFTVSATRLLELKEELRQVALKFIDEAEHSLGEEPVSLTLAFFPLKENGGSR